MPTYIILMAGITAIVGYWIALPRLLPQWNQLLTQIAVAQDQVARDGWLSGKPSAFRNHPVVTPIDYTIGVITLILFYLLKILVARGNKQWATKVVMYMGLVCLIIPYLYICWEDWENPHVYFIGNWLGVPVAVLVVPTASFAVDVLSPNIKSIRWLIGRSALELLVGIPVWSYFWIYFSFFILQFGWI